MFMKKRSAIMITAVLVITAILGVTAIASSHTNNNTSVEMEPWGEANGQPVYLYTLTNSQGSTMKVTNYGARVTSLKVPDEEGNMVEVVLGFDNLQDYLDNHTYFGAIVGRYGNRIANGKFTLDGEQYSLIRNNADNHLHGGHKGFDQRVWRG